MKVQTTKKKISETFLISMTDVVFLLLIFLMLTSNFVTQAGIKVRLPGSTSGTQQAGEIIHITYINPSQIILNDKMMDINQLRILLPGFFHSKEQTVRLYTDQNTVLQEVIGIMDIIRNTGFEKITIATKQLAKQP